MFRRSRFSIRPNVGTAGRTAAAPQEAPSASQEAGETPKDVSENSTAETENKSVVTPSEKPTPSGDGNDQNGEGTSTSAAVQRRKRFSIKPKVAPGRLSTLSRTPKSPVKASETPVETSISDLYKPTTSSQTGTTVSPRGLQSPRRRRPSEDSRQPKLQPKPTIISCDSSGPLATLPAEDLQEQKHLSKDAGKQLESTSDSPVKDSASGLPDKVPPSLPDREASEISEKAKTLISSKSGLSLSTPAFSLSRLLNDPSDMMRIAKAQKLRELLRQEMHKEKHRKKAKEKQKEFSLDPAKMTMRDLIRYLPESNPMSSSLEESVNENETVVPPSPGREESPERAQEPVAVPKTPNPRDDEEEEAQEDQEEEEEEALMVPQVKVAEDGTLIIDEESLTVEVQRTKGPNPVQDRDPIFERGSTTTYASFRKATYTKPWSSEETDMFFLAISMVGTDFSMICQLFPHRARSEIKNKFKKEERANAWRIDKAFRERRKLDIEYFSKLLEKILEVQKNRKKLKSLADKNAPKKEKKNRKTGSKGKKAVKKLSDVEEENEEGEDDIPDLEGEGEKENEDLCNEGGTPVSSPKKKRKRKNNVSKEAPKEKKNKMGEKDREQDEAGIPEDAEAALPEDRTNSDISEKAGDANAAKDAAIKPAKLSRGRAPKPLLPLGRKWGKKPPKPSTKAGDAAPDDGDESVTDGASKEQANKDALPLKQANKKKSHDDGDSSEEEETSVQPLRPTRYGRMPKPTKPLNYPAKEDTHSSASESSSAAKPKPKATAKRGRSSQAPSSQESKKPKLVTLRASQSDYSDEDDENQWAEDEAEEEQPPACGSSNDGIAPAFVPASLRSPHPMISEVEETMEEDVIDFLSSEHTDVNEDESYNEAAQTLLTIGNLAHLSQPANCQIVIQEQSTETISVTVTEASQHLEEEMTQEENGTTSYFSAASGHGVAETPETVITVELQNSTADNEGSVNQQAGSDMDPSTELHASPEGSKKDSPPAKKGRLPKVEPKPNLGRASRVSQSKSQQETFTAEESHEDTPELSGHRVAETPETFITVELQNSTADNERSINQQAGSDMDPSTELHASPEGSKKDPPPAKKGRLPKVKPKPNLGRASRVSQSKSQQETSTAEESREDAPELSETTRTQSSAQEIPESICEYLLKDDHVSCSEVSLAQEQSVRQEMSAEATSDPETQRLKDSGDSKSTDCGVVTTQSCTDNLEKTNTVVTEPQTGQVTHVDPALVQESSEPPASDVAPLEDLSDGKKPISDAASSPQTRKSRFQRVKPKPNLAQTSRAVRSAPQISKETVEKDSRPIPKVDDKTMEEVSAEPSTSAESQSLRSGSVPAQALELGSAPTLPQELPTTEKTNAIDKIVGGQGELEMATSDQKASEKQNISETLSEPYKEQTTDDTSLTYEFTDDKHFSGEITLPKTDSVVTESPVEQKSNIDSAPVLPAEVVPIGQKQDRQEPKEVVSSPQTKRGRFQKVKPKPNVALASRSGRSKPQITKETAEKDSNLTPDQDICEQTEDVSEEPTCATSADDQSLMSESILPVSEGSTPALTVESGKTELERKNTRLEFDCQIDPRSSEDQIFSEGQVEPRKEQATRDTRLTPQPTVENLMSYVETTESSLSNLQTFDSVVTESAVKQVSNTDSVSVQEGSIHQTSCAQQDLPSSPKSGGENTSLTQTRRFQRIKPKPNVALTSRSVRPKPQATITVVQKDSSPTPDPIAQDETIVEFSAEPVCSAFPEQTNQITSPVPDDKQSVYLGSTPSPTDNVPMTEEKGTDVQDHAGGLVQIESTSTAVVSESSVELCSTQKPTEELSSTKEPMTDVGLDSSSESSQQNTPQRRRRFPKAKPNIGSMARGRQTKNLQLDNSNKPSEECNKDSLENKGSQGELKSTEKDSMVSVPTQSSSQAERLSSTELGPAESEKSVDTKNIPSSTEDQSTSSGLVHENKNTERGTTEGKSIGDTMSTKDEVEAGPSLSWDNKEDTSVAATETNVKPTEDLTIRTHIQSSENVPKEVEVKSSVPTNEQQTTESEGTTQLTPTQEVRQCSEATPSTSHSAPDDPLEPSDSSKSVKPHQTRRGRSVKPKPNLGRSRQAPQPQQAQNKLQADAVAASEGVDFSFSHEPPSELQHNTQKQVEGALSQLTSQDLPSSFAGSDFGCAAGAPDSSTQPQDAALPSAEESMSHPSLSIFPDMLSGNIPSDPNEEFFILDLTEIPVCQQGEVLDGAAEPLSYLPVAGTSIQQQQGVIAENLTLAAGDSALSNAAVTVSVEQSVETSLITVKDQEPDTDTGSVTEKQDDPHESTAVQPLSIPDTAEVTEESETPTTKETLQATTRRAKQKVKPNISRKKQANKTVAAKEEESAPLETKTTEESELPGFSVQPRETTDVVTEQQKKGGSRKNTAKKAPAEGSSSGTQVRQTRATRNRKPSDSLPETNTATAGKAAQKGEKVRTPHAARKQPEPAASTSYDVAPSSSSTQASDQVFSTPSAVLSRRTELSMDNTLDFRTLTSSQASMELFSSQQSLDMDSSTIEEATSVSQYFISDIFTDVEEG
ncbi:transcription factor TFIIIB component B'' homolog isoform X2 [Cheilinus undulatus]|uniref:transcription factor TFIIIB component B'' homolog isoform X2 n=1 Tax=Cheilinus undulatus TaxID=241271 RepID=UPI001BD47557|nr:transcription factor TFIIIB component B'' homolog isoform X2 [Cheilinus undulatus]